MRLILLFKVFWPIGQDIVESSGGTVQGKVLTWLWGYRTRADIANCVTIDKGNVVARYYVDKVGKEQEQDQGFGRRLERRRWKLI